MRYINLLLTLTLTRGEVFIEYEAEVSSRVSGVK